MMRIVVISGRSGSGKSSALHVLEDSGFYCIDNLPVALLPSLIEQADKEERLSRVAVSIDARNLPHAFGHINQILHDLPSDEYQLDVVYLDADDGALLQRFSATRRKHPLTSDNISLAEAIALEKQLLQPISDLANLTIDTTTLSVHELRSQIKERVTKRSDDAIAIYFSPLALNMASLSMLIMFLMYATYPIPTGIPRCVRRQVKINAP